MKRTAVLLLAAMILGLFCVSCKRQEAPPALGDAEAAARLAELVPDAMRLISSDYLKGTLYVLLFDGYTPPSETQKNETVVSDHIDPRYREENGVLLADVNFSGFEIRTEPVPESARVVSGNDRSVTVCMDYRTDGETAGTMRVRLVLENGSWLLDGPVY